jgi:hypothetical protein
MLKERYWHLAMRGSVDHANWLPKVEGLFAAGEATSGTPNFEVHFHA